MVLGILIAAGTVVAFVVSWNQEMASGFGISVPATVALDLGEDAGEHAVWRELEGTHATVNRPVLDLPDDIAITITDRRTGDTIRLTDFGGWRVRQQIMPGFVRNRRGVVYFDPPEHGEIRVSIEGTFDYTQPYRVSPSIRLWAKVANPTGAAGLLIGALLMLAGIAIVIARLLRAESRLEHIA